MSCSEAMIMRELRYCAQAPGQRHCGPIAQAQDEAEARGWLERIVHPPAAPGWPPITYYRTTRAGRLAIDLACIGVPPLASAARAAPSDDGPGKP